ncbi:transmembrane protein, putative [Medicago truncatula]|uniref:Transmembrane protein, putative n=1 Tax=Medicago truncatula TaxID=3880 RepID=A0A072UBX4_MEDTR|nr:transmembrane protein, putative [Medicago truncatula]
MLLDGFRLCWFSCLFGGPFCFVDSIFASRLAALVSQGSDVVVVLWMCGGGDSVVVVVVVVI